MEYRFAKLRLSQCQATSDRKARASFGADALGHAATAWLRFAGMDKRFTTAAATKRAVVGSRRSA